jgi:hypothetical protein
MLSSSVSMFVNKRSTVSASQFSRFARGRDSREALERLSSRSLAQRTKLLPDD